MAEETPIETQEEQTPEITVEQSEEEKPKKVYHEPTKKELLAAAKQRAIDNFEKGIADPEFKVIKMKNGKYRCTKRKNALPPEPINVNQIKENVRSDEKVNDEEDEVKETKSKKSKKPQSGKGEAHEKNHDPFNDIIYFNLNNQVNEQLNKRLDLMSQEIEKIRNKNTKLKGKYKQLKQAIFVTEEETVNEPVKTEEPNKTEEPTKLRVIRKSNAMDFNKYFK